MEVSKIQCSTCTSTKIYGYNYKGLPFCLNCAEKINKMSNETLNALREDNQEIIDFMDSFAGLPPRRNNPQIQRPTNINYNNFKIDRSAIGVINTGTINGSLKNINARLAIMHDSKELIQGLKSLTETIVNSPEIPQDQKQELLEFISVITDEMIKPRHERKQAVIQIVLKTMSDYANIILAIQIIWNVVHPLLITFFQ
jgi:hypothetical protein